MTTIAELGVVVRSQGVADATRDLDNLDKSATKVQRDVEKVGPAMQKASLSAKQLQSATRGLPAQFTDIATALASGQRPLQVFLQQGGQLKDMFGGIGPAAAAMGRYVLGLANPFTIAAAAVAAFALAEKSAADEADNLSRAIVLTNNFAGTSVRQLRAVAEEAARATGATVSAAMEAATQVVGTGRFTAEQIAQVTQAALTMQRTAGVAIDDTIEQFVRIADDPVRAMETLNKSQHVFTQQTIDQVKGLSEVGKTAQAAARGVSEYANAVIDNGAKIERNLSGWALLWQDVKDAGKDALDTVKRGLVETDASTKIAIESAATLAGTYNGLLAAALHTYGKIFALRSQAAKAAAEFGNVVGNSSTVDLLDYLRHRGLDPKFGLDVPQPDDLKPTRGGGGAARAARATLPNFAKSATDDLKRLVEQENRATDAFLDLQAILGGPLAQEMREHDKRVAELNELARQSPTALAGLNDALALEAKRHKDAAAEIERQMNPMGMLLDDMRFELDTIGKSNAARAVMNELRREGIPLAADEARSALAAAEAFDKEARAKQRSIDLMDTFRTDFSDALTDFVTGAKSAKDAFKDMFDSIAEQITRAIAQHWAEQLFGAQGTGPGGSVGGWFTNILGALFGNSGSASTSAAGIASAFFSGGGMGGVGFASGGYTGDGPRNEIAGVVHRGEFVIPAPVFDAMRKRALERSAPTARSAPVINQTIVVQGLMDSRTPSQLAQASMREQRRAAGRNA